MDITIQHPWLRRALGSIYPARLLDQFFGESLFDYDLLPFGSSTISPYYRTSLLRAIMESSNSGISEPQFMLPNIDSTAVRDLTPRVVLDTGGIRLGPRDAPVRSDRDRFSVYLDVKHFSPEELTVKVIEGYLEIRGKHGERQDDHGYISRQFQRRYRLPSNVDQSSFTCSLSPDGLLTLCAPKVTSGADVTRSDRSIPVTRDDKPSSAPSS